MKPFSLEKNNEIAVTVTQYTNTATATTDTSNPVTDTATFNVETQSNRSRGFKLF